MELPEKIEELHALLHSCFDCLSVLEVENVALRQENADLCVRLGMDSGNSHQPPSSDVYKKKKVKLALPKEEGKLQGGQKGHLGKNYPKQ